MCSGSKRKVNSSGMVMEGGSQNQEELPINISILLELSASDDLVGFKNVMEKESYDVDEPSFWYSRRIGSKKMKLEERTPLMIAAMFGSIQVLKYILDSGHVDINRACGSDGATALHCAVAGGSPSAVDTVKILLDHSADPNLVDSNGNRPCDLITPSLNLVSNLKKNMVEIMLKGSGELLEQHIFNCIPGQQQQEQQSSAQVTKEGTEKKEYPIDLSLPDIKNGIYGTDEFRMYTFKVKPCSRAYSHDWTECPFVHPGENARRRDPRKYHYSCVPCPEFRKGSCSKVDACEYAHGIFECWLHPAQYRTRLCKDETGCNRRVCFFAHKPEELRPLYASTGSAMPSPRSYQDITSISPLSLGSSSTPPMTPVACSSPMAGGAAMWQTQAGIAPPALQLPGSRLKTALSARDMDVMDVMDLLGMDGHRLSSPSGWNNSRLGGVKPTNLEDLFGSLDSSVMPQLQGLSLDSPTGIQIRQNMNHQLRTSYPTSLSSSPARASSSFVGDPVQVVLNSRSSAFAKRSQSFIDRSALNLSRHSGLSSPTSVMPSKLSDWGSPDGKLDWDIQGEELTKLRKSASFGFRNNGSSFSMIPTTNMEEPNVSYTPSLNSGQFNTEEMQQYQLNSGGPDILPPWVEQLYMEQEQMVA